MTSKRIFALVGHPAQKSLCDSLVTEYIHAAKGAGHEVRRLDLADMRFDPNLAGGHFHTAAPLEPDLQAFFENLKWCEHFVLAHPLWWGGQPAQLKGVFDRTLLPGAAFAHKAAGVGFPEALLKGRSTRTLITADTPAWFLRWGYGNPIVKQTGRQIYSYCGMRPNRFSLFSIVKKSSDSQRAAWLKKARELGRQAR